MTASSPGMTVQGALTGLLAAQILLTAFTWWPRDDGSVEPRKLVPFEKDAITAVTVASTTTRTRNAPLELVKKDGAWVVQSEFDYPADPAKVDELLDKMLALQVRRPLATKAVNHDALFVSAEKATRTVSLAAGDQKLEIHAGTASGSRMNVRVAGEDEVYEVSGVGAWSIRDLGSAYYDTQWLDVDPTSLARWELTNAKGTTVLERDASGLWTSPGLGEGQVLVPAAIDKALTHSLKLTMSAPADPKGSDPTGRIDHFVVRWTLDDGTVGGYSAFPAEQGVVARRDGEDRPVSISSQLTRDTLEGTSLDTLLVEPSVD